MYYPTSNLAVKNLCITKGKKPECVVAFGQEGKRRRESIGVLIHPV
jgi:hypothetical protein